MIPLNLFHLYITQSTGLSSVSALRIRTLTDMDDDWKITVNNTILSDPQVISSGQQRDMTFYNIPINSHISISLWDGAPTQYKIFNWEATIYWPDTTITILTGGSTFSSSTLSAPRYFNNGCFYVAKTQPTQPWPYTTSYELLTGFTLAVKGLDFDTWVNVFDNVGSMPLSAGKKISKACSRFVMYNVFTGNYSVLGNTLTASVSLPNSGYFALATQFLDEAPMVDCSHKIIGFKFYGQHNITSVSGSGFVGSTDYYKAFVKIK